SKILSGVKYYSMNVASEKLNISFDDNIVSLSDIQAAVDKSGYKTLTDTEQKTFAVTGMTCASCVQTIEKAISKLDGVIESNVNLATEKMAVTYDPAVVSVSDIIQAVSKSGYE